MWRCEVAASLYRRPCPRTLDRPIQIFGLEPEDLVGVGLVAIALLFLSDGIVAVGTGLSLWMTLIRLKAGKPPGHLYSLAYKHGLADLLPEALRAPHVLPRRVTRLSPFTGEEDDDLARAWWAHRRPPA
jgi:type IV conjugative transfer system protein TraL